MGYIGESIERLDAKSKVTGSALYPSDFNMPDQLYMKVLFGGRPHAIIKNLNTSKALSIQGVVAIYTAKDVPVNEYGLGIFDQPVLCGPGSTKPGADHVRFIGDQIAIVVAETEEIAAKAKSLIEVEFEDLPVISNIEDAIKPNAYILHPDKLTNEFCHYHVKKGDTETAFEECDTIIERTYRTPVQEHAYLQPEAGIAYKDEEDRITVVVGGQWTHEDQLQIAHALNIPLDKVRVVYPAIGGAFGGREDMSVQIILALAVMRLSEVGINRPVKIIWSREESIIGHHKRHEYKIKAKWGAKANGKIHAAEIKIEADGGAYAYTSTKVLGNAVLLATGPYEIPNVKIDAHAIYTNNIPGGAFRGFGGPQAIFEAEMQVNLLAEALGLDPVEFRFRNLYNEGSLMSVGSPIPKGVSIRDVTDRCAHEAGWKNDQDGWRRTEGQLKRPEDPVLKMGRGFACGYKNIGFSYGAKENCTAKIELFGENEIENAVLYHAGAEVGQGAHTVFAQFAADSLGISIEKINLVLSDTSTSEDSGSVSASRMTFMAGNAIKGAAESVLKKWRSGERPAVASYTYRPPATSPFDPETGECNPNFAYGYVAVAVDVIVNIENGEIHLTNVICANDVGKAINPIQVQGQIEGAIVQAAGYALMEKFSQVDGYVKTDRLSTYLIPTILDIPDSVHSIIMEVPDPIGPYGARGMGEMPFLPFVPAVMDAVHNATGIWFYDFPLTAERVLKGLGKLKS